MSHLDRSVLGYKHVQSNGTTIKSNEIRHKIERNNTLGIKQWNLGG